MAARDPRSYEAKAAREMTLHEHVAMLAQRLEDAVANADALSLAIGKKLFGPEPEDTDTTGKLEPRGFLRVELSRYEAVIERLLRVDDRLARLSRAIAEDATEPLGRPVPPASARRGNATHMSDCILDRDHVGLCIDQHGTAG